jgi:hypothetical protein
MQKWVNRDRCRLLCKSQQLIQDKEEEVQFMCIFGNFYVLFNGNIYS